MLYSASTLLVLVKQYYNDRLYIEFNYICVKEFNMEDYGTTLKIMSQ